MRDPDLIIPARAQVAAMWRSDPLLSAFLEHERGRSEAGEYVRTPRDAVAVQRQEALLLVTIPDLLFDAEPDRIGRLAFALQHAGFLWGSPTVYWPREILKLAFGMPLPKHIVSADVCPWDSVTFVFQRSWGVHEVGEDADKWSTHTVHLRREADRLDAWTVGVGHREVRLNLTSIDFGARYPEDVPGLGANVLAALAFVNSPFVRAAKVLVGPKSKSAQRRTAWTPTDEPDVHVIRLRAEAANAVRDVERAQADHTWTHRWIVRGHYRAQWYPSSRSHKVIWICPYIKGPEDTPLKMPVYAVVR